MPICRKRGYPMIEPKNHRKWPLTTPWMVRQGSFPFFRPIRGVFCWYNKWLFAGMARRKFVTKMVTRFYTVGGHSVTKRSVFWHKTIPSGAQWCNDYRLGEIRIVRRHCRQAIIYLTNIILILSYHQTAWKSIFAKRNRPEYSQDGATRAEIKLSQKSGGSLLKPKALILGAVGPDLHRLAEIQAKHAHKAFCIDPGSVITHQNSERLDGGNLHKILHVSKGV